MKSKITEIGHSQNLWLYIMLVFEEIKIQHSEGKTAYQSLVEYMETAPVPGKEKLLSAKDSTQ